MFGEIDRSSDDATTMLRPSHKLLGHSKSICSVAVQSELDICVSGGCDGRVVLHSLRSGNRLRVLSMAQDVPLANGLIRPQPDLVAYVVIWFTLNDDTDD